MKKKMISRTGYKCIAIKTNISLSVCFKEMFGYYPASVHEVRHPSASEALPASSEDPQMMIFYE